MINQSKQITIQAGLIFLTMLTEFSPPSSRSGNTNVLLNLTKHQQTNLYCTSKIHLNQSINYLSMEDKK